MFVPCSRRRGTHRKFHSQRSLEKMGLAPHDPDATPDGAPAPALALASVSVSVPLPEPWHCFLNNKVSTCWASIQVPSYETFVRPGHVGRADRHPRLHLEHLDPHKFAGGGPSGNNYFVAGSCRCLAEKLNEPWILRDIVDAIRDKIEPLFPLPEKRGPDDKETIEILYRAIWVRIMEILLDIGGYEEESNRLKLGREKQDNLGIPEEHMDKWEELEKHVRGWAIDTSEGQTGKGPKVYLESPGTLSMALLDKDPDNKDHDRTLLTAAEKYQIAWPIRYKPDVLEILRKLLRNQVGNKMGKARPRLRLPSARRFQANTFSPRDLQPKNFAPFGLDVAKNPKFFFSLSVFLLLASIFLMVLLVYIVAHEVPTQNLVVRLDKIRTE